MNFSTNKPQAYLFDIDGTLADNRHRRHWVAGKPKNWKAYNVNMDIDAAIIQTIDVLRCLSNAGYKIIIVTGRESVYKDVTVEWLERNHIPYDDICMRPEKDYSKDSDIKERMYHKLKEEYDIQAVFDDRKQVKRKWNELGVFVFDVNQYDEEF